MICTSKRLKRFVQPDIISGTLRRSGQGDFCRHGFSYAKLRSQDILTFAGSRGGHFWAWAWPWAGTQRPASSQAAKNQTIGPKTCSSAAVCGESAGFQATTHQKRFFRPHAVPRHSRSRLW